MERVEPEKFPVFDEIVITSVSGHEFAKMLLATEIDVIDRAWDERRKQFADLIRKYLPDTP